MARRPFPERRTYRQNRLQDAARLLPVLGLLLFFAPVFIRSDVAGGDPQMSGWLVYYLVVWTFLIVLTAAVSRALGGGEAGRPAPEQMGEPIAAEPTGEQASGQVVPGAAGGEGR